MLKLLNLVQDDEPTKVTEDFPGGMIYNYIIITK